MNENFYKEIQQFSPFNEQEEQDKKVFLKYLETFDDIFYRENEFAHITSSPWILNETKIRC